MTTTTALPSNTPRTAPTAPPTRRIALTAAAAWVILAVGAVANGVFRQAFLSPTLGEPVARAVSILVLVGIIFAVSFGFVRAKWMRLSDRGLLAIGAAWAVGSALFEFGLGRLVLDMPWSELLASYNLLAGQWWVFAPISMLIGPLLARRSLAGRAALEMHRRDGEKR